MCTYQLFESSKNKCSICVKIHRKKDLQTRRTVPRLASCAMGANACSKICGFMGRSEEVTETKLDNLGPLKEGRIGNQQIHTVYDIFDIYID